MTTRLAFYKAPGTLTDRLIRWGSNSPYSHVEFVRPDGRGLSASIREGCVRVKEIDFTSGHWDVIEVPWQDAELAIDRIMQHDGKAYDTWGVLACHVVSLARSHPDKWFCSELIAYGLGLPNPHLYSPGSLAATVQHLTTFSAAQRNT